MCVLLTIGTKSALEKKVDQSIENFHKFLILWTIQNLAAVNKKISVVRLMMMKKIQPRKIIVLLKILAQYQVLLGINRISQLKLQFLAG